ncbi:MAG: glycine cleavage system protein GcvH [Candidatus Aminicenantales bacterium]
MFPNDFYYTKDHEWLQVKGEEAIVGITNFAQKQLGDIVYIEFPSVGTSLEVHQTIGTIESVKAVSDVYSPISGEVLAVNTELNGSPELVNQDPHGKGWIIRLKIKNKSDLDQLTNAADYEKFLEGLEG